MLAATGGEQRPHEYHALLGEHYLSVPPSADSVTVVAATAPVPDAVSVDLAPLDAAQLRMLTEPRSARARTEIGNCEIGELYEKGRGIVQDYEAAVALYGQAAEQGDPRGQGNLGAQYPNGRGVEEEGDDVGVRWYRRTAEQSDSRGRHNLGAAYRDAPGDVPQNHTEVGSMVPSFCRAGRRSRAEQPRRHVRRRMDVGAGGAWPNARARPRRAGRPRRIRPLVPPTGRAGPRPCAQNNLGRMYER